MERGNEASQQPDMRGFDGAALVREGILRAIHRGELDAGQRLVEAKLCEAFGSVRGYVREALARLESEGIVEIMPFRGARVRSFTPEEARNIDLVITSLMALAGRQAAMNIDGGDNRDRLRAALAAMEAYGEGVDGADYVAARMHFYHTVIEISGNTEIGRICPLLQGQMTKRQTWLVYDEPAHLDRLNRYRAIGEAIGAGDGPAAEARFWDTLIFDRP